MARNISKMSRSPKQKTMNVAFWGKKNKSVTETHQQNAEEGKYGDKFKAINKAREDREKLLKLLQEQ